MSKYLFDNLKMINDFKNDKSTAIILDIDGTISEIAPTPQEAVVNSAMHAELIKLKEKFDLLAIISGRSVNDARAMVGIEDILYVGNHGLEYFFDGQYSVAEEVEKYLHQIEQSADQLNIELGDIEGILFEDKGICYSIHYRQCNDGEVVRKKILNSLKNGPESKNLQISEGRKLVEIKPPLGFDKGVILHRIIEKHDLNKVIYLGDDITDLDAFKKLSELENEGKIRSASILVFSNEIPSYVKNSTSFFVDSVNEVLNFFRWLLD
ncbi:MAG: trehalose-phosphatase [Methanobacteriaceae archaeon]|jgi:trehalose 6-phosphate phosphatase|nr:trehalose-phosphatase [Methanobacteriaceae archaeon]MDO9043982.1 trehalose-phosphatase [Methanobacteriaceae archaeon]MDO9627194.1 trehalose-phosphatase [Methanobacteriaceae archaeon]MDP2836298.1 trehalose-phosphatase [Methanobacteriaceae archaeon]MDP3033721.1 trehalose-phosphatase [Methanobacteriaceae archaeon]